jgi:hypothetical protein
MQYDFVFITAGKCCINWCVALHRPGGGVSLLFDSLTFRPTFVHKPIYENVCKWENQFLQYWTESVLLAAVLRHSIVYVCACTCVLLLAGLIFFRMHAAQKALGRRALANKLHFMHQVVVFCAPRLIFPNANKY